MKKLHFHTIASASFLLVLGFLFVNIAIVDAAKTKPSVSVKKQVANPAPRLIAPVSKATPKPATVKLAVAKSVSVVKAPAPKQVVAMIEPVPAPMVSTSPVVQKITGSILPTKLIIPSLGVNAAVKALGLEPDGKMDVPDNFTEVGWYKLGSKPGDMGSAVMGAHVDNGGAVSGVFKNLKNLAIGDEISVADENGKMLTFRVSEKRVLDYREKSTGDIFGNVGKKRLNLITCYGTYMPSLDTYNQRLIVFADIVE